MSVELQVAETEVEAVVDTRASDSVVGKCVVRKLLIWERKWKVNIRQADESYLGGNCIVNTSFNVIDSFLVLGKFG